ncbi:MAG: hypothetical protein QNJ61_05510 [Desulfobacterales bacterium]|nr:hypothetical protein [Desulfobacterales bacterium]
MGDSILGRIGKDLLKLEVNTILKDSSSVGDKMPSNFREAFCKLAKNYHFQLIDIKDDFGVDVRGDECWTFGGMRSFGELRQRALQGEKAFKIKIASETAKLKAPASGKDLSFSRAERQQIEDNLQNMKRARRMLQRIQAQSELMVSIFKELERIIPKKKKGKEGYATLSGSSGPKELPTAEKCAEKKPEHLESRCWNNDISLGSIQTVDDLNLSPSQILRLRKAWDLGTEEIVMQTIIDIEGDVTTRIMRSFAQSPEQTVLNIHNQAVLTSTNMWKSLVKTVADMVGSTFEALLRK